MSRKRLLAGLLLAWTLSASARAQEVTDAKASPTPTDFSKEAYVIERSYTRVSEESDGTGSREVTAEVKVLADAGVKAFAVLNFVYTSANEMVDIDYVRVRKPDGTIIKTPDYNIQDMPGEVTRTAPLYSDIHEKHVAVKGLAVGDVLEYMVRFRVAKPEVAGHFWYEYEFTKRAIVRDERLELSFPKDKYVKVVSPAFKPETKEEGARRVYRWRRQNLVVEQADPNEIPRRIPPNPDVQVTTFASWEEVGRWYAGLQKDSLTVTPAIQAKAAELTKGLKSDDEKIHAIYNFVSLKYHYIGLDFGIGRYQPHAADDVLDNGYGDCKDKQTLLASLLKAAGIDAWPVLIHATRKLDPDVPSPAQFNHVIGVVAEGDKLVWLDTTPEVAPYGLLMLTLRGKEALVIPTNKTPVLMETPQNAPFPQVQDFSMEGKLDANGTFTGHAEQSYHGDTEVLLRMAFRQVPQSQYKEAVQRFSYGLNFRGDVSNVTLTSPDDTSKDFDVAYDYLRKNYSDWDNRQIGPPLPPIGLEMSKDSKKPHEPVLLGGIGELVYKAKITLPASYSATVPANVDLVRSYAEYHATYSLESGVLAATRRVIIKKPEVGLSSWEDYRDFGKAISDDENQYIHLSGGGGGSATTATTASADLDAKFRLGYSALQNRDFTRAEELFREVISGNPKYHGAHYNLGLALLSGHDVTGAVTEFRKEEEVSPDYTGAYQAAVTYLTSNGERIEEWRKLLKVDPNNQTAASRLANLLYYSEQYPEAISVLEKAVAFAPGSAELQFELARVYLKSGQNEKALTSLEKTIEDKSDEPDILNEVAYTLAENKLRLDLAQQWAEAAVKKLETKSVQVMAEADASAGVTYQLSLTWDTLGWVYFLNGDTNRSESYVRAAWLLGQQAVVGKHLGELYEKEGKRKAAAHTYELALAAVGQAPIYPTGSVPDPMTLSGSESLTNEITSLYQKLTGTKPSIRETNRLPNGQWTKSVVEQFSEMRTVKFGKLPNLSGSAAFSIVFAPGRIESVDYQSGEQSLKVLADKIKAARYQVEFPAKSEARIRRKALANCSSISGCMIVLVPPSPVGSPPVYFPTY